MSKTLQRIIRGLIGYLNRIYPIPYTLVNANLNLTDFIPLDTNIINGNSCSDSPKEENSYWNLLNEAEKMILLYRELAHPNNGENLREAISGTDYQSYLHFIFKSPEEGLDALTALQEFENQQGIRMKLENVPSQIRIGINQISELPEEKRKRQVVAYILSSGILNFKNPN